ncbi:Abi family protein [Microlunatus sagamiharensis]|nr:Abi family protein [Microlunatus sagamiharensis]
MRYDKPHLTYPEQIRLLLSRGLDVGDPAEATRTLQRIGYYRLSAYTYVLRQPGSGDASDGRVPRSDQFVEGAALADATKLHDFDQRLRRTILDGLQRVEIGLRSSVAYQLGKADPFGHLDPIFLDAEACSKPPEAGAGGSANAYDDWRQKYDELQHRSRGEDYVKHFLTAYEGEIPVWTATEFMTMGCLVYLVKLLSATDARRVSEKFRVKNREVLHGWLKALNVLRNDCAHNCRIWNRSTIYPPKRVNARMVEDDIHHLSQVDTDKLYVLVALLAYLLKAVEPKSTWISDFTTTMNKFPASHGMTPENMMGFPTDWRRLSIWQVAK